MFNIYWWGRHVLQLHSSYLINTIHQTNASKTWNCDLNIQYHTETVEDNFKNDRDTQTMHKDSVTTEQNMAAILL